VQYSHVAYGDPLLERLAGAAVEEAELATGLLTRATGLVETHPDAAGVLLLPLHERLVDVEHAGPVEHGGRGVDLGPGLLGDLVRLGAVVLPALCGGPPEVGLQYLAEVHAARDAERVQDDVDRRAVLQERHVLLVDDLRDDALVAVGAGGVVALRDLWLCGHAQPERRGE